MIAHQITESLVITFTIHAEAINLNNEFCPSKCTAADIGVYILYAVHGIRDEATSAIVAVSYAHTHTYICKSSTIRAECVRRHWA